VALMLGTMFTVDEAAAAAIRHAFNEGGDLAAAVELRRLFPGVADNARARACVQIIAGWRVPPSEPTASTSRWGTSDTSGPPKGSPQR
jgi:hypothetical protein